MRRFEVNTYQYYTEKVNKDITIVILSDIHNNYNHFWVDTVNQINPDFIFIAGDLVLGRLLEGTDSDVLWSDLNPLAFRLLKELIRTAPVYMSLGNHEVYMTSNDFQCIKELGVVILDNGYEVLDNGMVVGGLTSGLTTRYRFYVRKFSGAGVEKIRAERHYEFYHHGESDLELTTPDYSWGDEFEKQDGYRILLSHHVEYWSYRQPMLKNRYIDLTISGHAHGGQIRLFGHSLYAPGQGVLPKYTKGEYMSGHGGMVVTAGLSNTYKVPRINNPFELVKIEIVRN